MMSFAWANSKELYILDTLTEVMMIDTIEKTNNEKRPLLIAYGNDSNGMFQWVFIVVFPRLILKHILSKVQIDITDGDPQELQKLIMLFKI